MWLNMKFYLRKKGPGTRLEFPFDFTIDNGLFSRKVLMQWIVGAEQRKEIAWGLPRSVESLSKFAYQFFKN